MGQNIRQPNWRYQYLNFIQTDVLRERISLSLPELKKREFDAIAFTGNSGAIIAPSLALEMDKSLLLVRKEDGHHSSLLVEGDYSAQSYIIVDDFVASGATVERIQGQIKMHIPEAKCVGIWSTRDLEWDDSFILNSV